MLEKVNDSRNKVFERILPESVEIVTKTPARPCLRPKAFDNLCIGKTTNYQKNIPINKRTARGELFNLNLTNYKPNFNSIKIAGANKNCLLNLVGCRHRKGPLHVGAYKIFSSKSVNI